MAKYLVTGGAGFIGSNLIDLLVQDSSNYITVVDDLSMGKKANLPQSDRISFYERSITEHEFINELLTTEHFDYIVLLAAVASVADSVERPYETHQINQQANMNIIETLRREKIPFKKLFFASSAAVYGNRPEVPKNEDMAVLPLTQYAVDKYATERAIINYSRLYDMPMVCARFFNVFGPKQNPASPYSGVLSIVLNCLKESKKFTYFGDGSQTRDFIYVGDVVRGILGLLQTPGLQTDVFNIANGRETALATVVAELENITGKELNVAYAPHRSGDIQRSVANISKIEKLGILPHTPLGEGLKKYVEAN